MTFRWLPAQSAGERRAVWLGSGQDQQPAGGGLGRGRGAATASLLSMSVLRIGSPLLATVDLPANEAQSKMAGKGSFPHVG